MVLMRGCELYPAFGQGDPKSSGELSSNKRRFAVPYSFHPIWMLPSSPTKGSGQVLLEKSLLGEF
jgi:hypothetical protein